jgi:hypothetical protein
VKKEGHSITAQALHYAYAIRTGVHRNTAFGLAFALDYARTADHKPLREMAEARSQTRN